MAKFEPNKPVVTDVPTVTVDGGLPVGKHRFQLVVEDEQGQRSAPAEAAVLVVKLVQPPAVSPGGADTLG